MDKSLHHWESELCCEPYRIQGHQPFLDLQPLAATLSEGFFLWKLCSQTSLVVSLMAQWIRILLTVQEMWVQFLSWEDSPGEGNGNPLQYSCLGNPMDGGVWRATVHGLSRVGRDSPTQQQTIQPFWITADTCLTSTLTACQLQLQFFINNSCK